MAAPIISGSSATGPLADCLVLVALGAEADVSIWCDNSPFLDHSSFIDLNGCCHQNNGRQIGDKKYLQHNTETRITRMGCSGVGVWTVRLLLFFVGFYIIGYIGFDEPVHSVTSSARIAI